MITASGSDNPYVGPRAFRRGEALPGRDREASGLVGKLLGERIMLLHSPSGAGKTSLIQAAVAPQMEEAGFQLCARTRPTLSGLRVGTRPPGNLTVGNRYVFSTVLGLLPDRDPAQLADMRIAKALELVGHPEGSRYQLLLFDQFEEVLVLDPTDRDAKLEFFKQLGEALDAQHRWALLAIREDYMGGLDRFARYLPTELRTHYRLDFLEQEAALEAIRCPAADRGVTVTEEAALTLFDDLRQVRRQGSLHSAETVPGAYVEPVQLQVVCHRLWRRLRDRANGRTLSCISAEQIRPFRDIEDALGTYYAEAVQETARRTRVPEAVIRDWFETELVDERGLRRQSPVGPDTGNPRRTDKVLHWLERRYLVRGDVRAGTTWWELTHDRMIEPLLADNRRQLSKAQRTAREWVRRGRDRALLLSGDELHAARRAVAQRSEDRTTAERAERELVAESQAARKEAHLRQRVNTAGAGLLTLVVVEAVAIGWILLRRKPARRARG